MPGPTPAGAHAVRACAAGPQTLTAHPSVGRAANGCAKPLPGTAHTSAEDARDALFCLICEVIVRRQDREHCASITRMIRHYVARRAQVTEGHPHNAAYSARVGRNATHLIVRCTSRILARRPVTCGCRSHGPFRGLELGPTRTQRHAERRTWSWRALAEPPFCSVIVRSRRQRHPAQIGRSALARDGAAAMFQPTVRAPGRGGGSTAGSPISHWDPAGPAAQSGYSSLRRRRASLGPFFGVRSSTNE